jgi:hypothetical protein
VLKQLKIIGLISCTKAKQDYPCKAFKMYSASNLFRKAYAYAVKNYDSVAIISAKHGLLLPDDVIVPYNLTLNNMNSQERKQWAQMTFVQINSKLSLKDVGKIFFHAGKKYREHLIPKIREIGIPCEAPLAHLKIGEQMAWYNSQLV